MAVTHIYKVSVAMAALLAGCQQMPTSSHMAGGSASPAAYYNVTPPYTVPVAEIEPSAPPVAPSSSYIDSGKVERMESALMQMGERLQRVEKAMLRLDRRMQLVERNELNRMGGENLSMSPQQEQLAMDDLDIGPMYSDGFRPVSSNGSTRITSSLQAAPRGNSGGGSFQVAARGAGLPSLADPAPSLSEEAESDLSVWTVRYENTKVWPDRAQLPASRDVVEALRNGSHVTVFARGKHPNAVEFRERVKAISRYLSKVASVETVPISTIPAPHLDNNTIEIFAAH